MQSQGGHATWPDVFFALVQFARASPVWFGTLVVLPTMFVVGAVVWFVKFIGADHIARLASGYVSQLRQKPLPALDTETQGDS